MARQNFGLLVLEAQELKPIPSFFAWRSGAREAFDTRGGGAVLARFFTFVVPAAFTGYLPALAILGRSDPSGLPDWLPWTSPLAALLAATLAGLLWRSGIRHYVGAGG